MFRRSAIIAMLMACANAELGAQSKLNRGQKLNADGAIRIYNLVGSVRVTGWNRDSVSVKGSLGKGNTFHMGGAPSGMKMFVEGMDERNPAPAALEVSVPVRSKVWVKTATASIEVTGVNGSLDLYVVGGDIKVVGNPADVNAEAIDGSITILGNPSWVRAKSASGDVKLNGVSSDAALSTVSGRIDVSGRGYEKAKFETITGPIRFVGTFERGGLATFDTHSGIVEIAMPQGSPADFDVVSIAGTIANRLTSGRPVAGRYGRGAELNTSSGDGGTRVVVRSFKGSVVLDRGEVIGRPVK